MYIYMIHITTDAGKGFAEHMLDAIDSRVHALYVYALYVCLICLPCADTGKGFAEYMLDAIDRAAEHDRDALRRFPPV
jgi:imidazoleglycerol phosphate dehydratase HisB